MGANYNYSNVTINRLGANYNYSNVTINRSGANYNYRCKVMLLLIHYKY